MTVHHGLASDLPAVYPDVESLHRSVLGQEGLDRVSVECELVGVDHLDRAVVRAALDCLGLVQSLRPIGPGKALVFLSWPSQGHDQRRALSPLRLSPSMPFFLRTGEIVGLAKNLIRAAPAAGSFALSSKAAVSRIS